MTKKNKLIVISLILYLLLALGWSLWLSLRATTPATNAAAPENEIIIVPEPITPPAPEFDLVALSSGTIREITAFNSVPEQTDDTPCIDSDSSNICERYAAGECLIAGNFAPLGSQHYIDGIGLCTLTGRMNSRFKNRVDLFMDKDIAAAKNFGLQRRLVKSLN